MLVAKAGVQINLVVHINVVFFNEVFETVEVAYFTIYNADNFWVGIGIDRCWRYLWLLL